MLCAGENSKAASCVSISRRFQSPSQERAVLACFSPVSRSICGGMHAAERGNGDSSLFAAGRLSSVFSATRATATQALPPYRAGSEEVLVLFFLFYFTTQAKHTRFISAKHTKQQSSLWRVCVCVRLSTSKQNPSQPNNDTITNPTVTITAPAPAAQSGSYWTPRPRRHRGPATRNPRPGAPGAGASRDRAPRPRGRRH